VQELSNIDVLIIDCQSTGATPALGAVLEIGWGIANASLPGVRDLQAHWVTLPEGHRVNFQVRRLTGFDEAHATSAITPENAWSRLRQTMSFDASIIPAAIHFARFELAFLRDWATRFEPAATFPLDAVCVHAIACRLYPDLPRRSIRALAGFLGHSLDPARRSLGHVEATAFIWGKLAAELATQGIRNWDQLGGWLTAPRPPVARSKRRRYPLPSAKYRALPDEPGVYRFVRSNGDVLYVGKAASLRKRVAGHFTAGSSTTERALEMLTQVHDIHVNLSQSPLEAALHEIEQIKALRPPYNVQLIGGDPHTWFCSPDLVATSRQPDAIHSRGPLPSTFSVRSLGAISALIAGQNPTPSLRARAVGTSDRFAPGEAVFAAGFALFTERHGLGNIAPAEVRRSLIVAARRLILASKSDTASEAADLDADDTGAGVVEQWDPERVVRHLERGVAHGYQLLQRARWLCLLYDSTVVFREPATERARLLVIRDGSIVGARDLMRDESVPGPFASRPLRDRQSAFDRGLYDRLRTLTTELKRILRDKGTVEIGMGRARWLRGSTLEALLRWV
jgi:DNA polymerase III subunit epsilon